MEIGGYFGLEIENGGQKFHDTPYCLKSGRSAISVILNYLKPVNVYVPFYTCNALLEPFVTQGITYTFYKLNSTLEIEELPRLNPGELLVYVNYFDIKRDYVELLSSTYGDRLLVDCTQAYFLKSNNRSWYFNSTRKFFGVPDGSDLYVPDGHDIDNYYNSLQSNKQFLTGHLVDRFNGDTQQGHITFRENEILNGQGIHRVSNLSATLISNINYERAITARQVNFNFVHEQLKDSNRLNIKGNDAITSSFYPYLPAIEIDKKHLWAQNIFIPVLWADCYNRENSYRYPTEVALSQKLIPIPTDHRYNTDDMQTIINVIKRYTQNDI